MRQCTGRAKEGYTQMMAVGGINRSDKAAIGTAKFQCIIEHIFQLDIPTALLQRVGTFSENFNACEV